MTQFFKNLFLILLTTTIIPLCAEEIECGHTTKKASDNYFGVAQFQVVPIIYENTAISLLGEIGPRSYRAGGTIGANYDCHWVKVGGEFLGQKMSYNFSTGNVKQWVQQYAVGGRYQYNMPCSWLSGIFIDAESSYSKSRHLHAIECDFSPTVRTLSHRQLDGTRYFNVEIGGQITPWECGNLLVGLGYNDLQYNRRYNCSHKTFGGVSVDLEFVQKFCENVSIDLLAQFRRPYTYAEALIDWRCETCYGVLTFGIFGGYVWGKQHLPNSTNAGIEIGFAFNQFNTFCNASSYCSSNYCCDNGCALSCDCQELVAWVNRPAVYMPTVLVDPEEFNVSLVPLVPPVPICTPPVITTAIPNQFACFKNPPPFVLDVTPFFSGNSLTYSASLSNESIGAQFQLIMNPSTGMLSILDTSASGQETATVTVTATNSCGSVSSSFNISGTCP